MFIFSFIDVSQLMFFFIQSERLKMSFLKMSQETTTYHLRGRRRFRLENVFFKTFAISEI